MSITIDRLILLWLTGKRKFCRKIDSSLPLKGGNYDKTEELVTGGSLQKNIPEEFWKS